MQTERIECGPLVIHALAHPQGCRGYLLVDPASQEAALIDVHLDSASSLAQQVADEGLRARWVVDTHTHADHPSGAAPLAGHLKATRVAHATSRHHGVTHHPDDQEPLALGDTALTVRHAPGHTPDHLVLVGEGALFSGDSLFIGGVARADFLGGDAGVLHDSIHQVMLPLPDDTLLLPGHDYAGRIQSTLGAEKRDNPWLQLADRDAFVKHLTDGAPAEPANMAALLSFNREGEPLPPAISAADTQALVTQGGARSVIDVRTREEVQAAHIPGSRHILMDEIPTRVEEVLATPAPRLILCAHGIRAEHVRRFLVSQGVGGVQTIEGGIVAYHEAGGELAGGDPGTAPGAGGCAAPPPPTGGCAAPPPPMT